MIIFKYILNISDEPVVPLPKGAEVLSVQVQHGEPYIWALVDELASIEERHFRIIGTGNPIYLEGRTYKHPIPGKFVGTFQLYNGNFIGHLFEA